MDNLIDTLLESGFSVRFSYRPSEEQPYLAYLDRDQKGKPFEYYGGGGLDAASALHDALRYALTKGNIS